MALKDVDLKDKTVLVRADFNVPQDENLNITDDARIRATLPTIKFILQNNAKKIILMSHLGRPSGEVVAKYSLKPVALRLQELLGIPVKFLDDLIRPFGCSIIRLRICKIIYRFLHHSFS